MSEQRSASELTSWTSTPSRLWFQWCNLCQTRRLVADYFEGYLAEGHGWFWVCSGCLLTEISDRLDDLIHGGLR